MLVVPGLFLNPRDGHNIQIIEGCHHAHRTCFYGAHDFGSVIKALFASRPFEHVFAARVLRCACRQYADRVGRVRAVDGARCHRHSLRGVLT